MKGLTRVDYAPALRLLRFQTACPAVASEDATTSVLMIGGKSEPETVRAENSDTPPDVNRGGKWQLSRGAFCHP
ncbi:hypothetical protein AHiyo6_12690 [Arthrobacter sp. Hiyo6]|nr:hypothetical protein AHiyo6_12690 [Arthrobacter sp. Hiyo6]